MADETTPLLKSGTAAKLAYGQLAILCYARWIDSWFFFTIFPYISRMIQETGIPQERIGFYSGLIESVYSVTECLFLLFFWTDISDRYGRKPVMVICLAGLTLSSTLFGFSTHIWQMIATRAMAGVFSGCLGTMRVMLGEITTEGNRAQAYSIWATAASLGTLLAPVAGGLLARPSDHYSLFRGVQIFERYPYLLPSLLMGLLGGGATIVAILFLRETLTSEVKSAMDDGGNSTAEVLRAPGVSRILVNGLWSCSLLFAWMAVEPVWCFTLIRLGGLGFTIRQISATLAAVAVMQGIVSLVIFPRLHKRVGTRGTMYLCTIAFLLAFSLPPLSAFFRARGMRLAFAITFFISLQAASFQSMVYTAGQMAVNEYSPSPAALGRMNSLSLCINMAGRAVTLSSASSLYAWGVDKHILGGQLAWVVLAVASAGYGASLSYFPRKPTPAYAE